jgi:antitoxin MazE
MNQHVKKWGNSAAVRIPASTLAAAGLKIDDPVEVRGEDGKVVIEKASNALDEPTLEELIAGITPDNRHEAIDWGPPVGKEIW